MSRVALLLLACQALAGCGLFRSGVVDVALADTASELELQVDDAGLLMQIEYHIEPDDVPAAVQKAMERLHPGGPLLGAERQVAGQAVLWQLARLVDDLRVEALFRTDGTLVQEQLQIAAEDVPEPVRRMVGERFPDATDPHWDVIRSGPGEVLAYHVRLKLGIRLYKLVLLPDGVLQGLWRQIPAELQLPVPLR